MSLYDDIITKTDHKVAQSSEWSSKTTSIKLLQDHLQVKRTLLNTSKNNNVNRRTFGGLNRTTTKTEEIVPSPVIVGGLSTTAKQGSSLLGGDWDINEEYDPKWPNDFEKLVKERKERRSDLKAKEPSLQVVATRSLGLDYDDEDDDEYDSSHEANKSKANATFAPPASLLENVEKVSSSAANSSSIGFEVSSVATKIMQKWGFREGQGLGREEQGISKALQVERTSKTQGIIVNETEKKNDELPIAEMLKNPSRVVLLRNMVGPGEVDSELEPETKEECSKYGPVLRCSIYESRNYESEEDAVRIFIEFASVESAIKALVDLNGRYFGGRIVKASFYDCDKFLSENVPNRSH